MGGDGLRGRVLVIEGGGGQAARRFPPREARPAPGLSAILAALAPQVLLDADGVDTVHLPSATDADGIRAHLRACVRHPGPLLVHVGGHLVRDRRSGSIDLDLGGHGRPSRLPWRAFAEELRLRPLQTGTLVIADLSAEAAALPQLRVQPSPLGAGLPLWAAVSPDPQQVGIFTRALVEALHGGQPGAGERLTPEQLQYQVHSVLRPETQIVVSHAPGWQVFRNTSRRLAATVVDPATPLPGPQPAAAPGVLHLPSVTVAPASEEITVEFLSPTATSASPQHAAPPAAPPQGAIPADAVPTDAVPADVVPMEVVPMVPPFDVPPLPPHPPTVHLRGTTEQAGSGPGPRAGSEDDLAPYREAIGTVVAAAEAGDHAQAVGDALALERNAASVHGADAEPVLKLRQVRAHVTRLAGLQCDAALLYRDVALSLLDGRGADDPETRQAAANAEACWRAIEDDAQARRLGPDLVRLRQAVPDPRRLAAVERHFARLRADGREESRAESRSEIRAALS